MQKQESADWFSRFALGSEFDPDHEELANHSTSAEAVYNDIVSKRKATGYLHRAPELIEPVLE